MCQPARPSCAVLCVCASIGLHAQEASRPTQLGQSLTDHGGSSGGASAAASSRSHKQQAGTVAAVANADAEVLAGQPSSGRKPPWNKGLSIPEETRAKISLAQKRRWKKNPGLRSAIGAKLAGKTPWNKGLKMSEETRAKMSAARLNSTHMPATLKKMSQSHTGKRHTPATLKALSAKLSGRAKPEEHRQAIAAAQRRRHAATRVLRAIEEVHGATAESPRFDPSRFRSSSAGVSSSGLKGVKGSRPATRTQVLATYRNQLREYRALQEELTHWTEAFAQRHGRKPRLIDVERTGIEWLIAKYKCYVMMRERLVMDTPQLRDKLMTAKPGAGEALTSMDESSSPSGGVSSGAARYAAAMEHRRAQAARAAPPAAADLAAAATAASPPLSSMAPRSVAASPVPWAVAPAARPAAVEGPSASGQLPTSSTAAGTAVDHDGRAAAEVDAVQTPAGSGPSHHAAVPSPQQPAASPRLRALQSAPANAPQRVRSAMAAALQYRAKKASETAAAASAAANAAAQPPAARPPRRTPLAADPATRLGTQADE